MLLVVDHSILILEVVHIKKTFLSLLIIAFALFHVRQHLSEENTDDHPLSFYD